MATIVETKRDVNAQNIQYMMMLARVLGDRMDAAQQQKNMSAFAQSLDPEPTSTINAQRLMSDQGFDALRSNVLEGTPATFGQQPGQPLTRMQMLQKALLHGIPPRDATGMINAMQPVLKSPKKATLSDHKLRLIEKRLAANPDFEGTPEHLRLLGVSPLKAETPEEKLKRLQALRKSAAGQYYGIEGGNAQPLFPKVYEYTNKEIAKLPMFTNEPEKIDIRPKAGLTPTPKTQGEYDALPVGAEFIDTDGKKKRKR